MKYYTIYPGDKLKEFVSHFWISEFEGGDDDTYNYLSTADSCSKIVFIYKKSGSNNLTNAALFSSVMQGQTQQHDKLPMLGGFEIFGINLFSHSIPHLFSLPSRELSNQMVDLETLLGQKGKDLNEKMAEAKSDFARVELARDFFEKALTDNYSNENRIAQAVKLIKANNGLVDIKELSDYCCLSQKQLERKFMDWVGFTPKLYSRIVRFETVLCKYSNQNTFTETALECGYFDQSHFIREFKEFSGYAPAQYFSLVG